MYVCKYVLASGVSYTVPQKNEQRLRFPRSPHQSLRFNSLIIFLGSLFIKSRNLGYLDKFYTTLSTKFLKDRTCSFLIKKNLEPDRIKKRIFLLI